MSSPLTANTARHRSRKIFQYSPGFKMFSNPCLFSGRSSGSTFPSPRLSGKTEINLLRLAYQWEKSVNNAIESMHCQALPCVPDEPETIESLLSDTKVPIDKISLIGDINAATEGL
jgi:hypothetical protein